MTRNGNYSEEIAEIDAETEKWNERADLLEKECDEQEKKIKEFGKETEKMGNAIIKKNELYKKVRLYNEN